MFEQIFSLEKNFEEANFNASLAYLNQKSFKDGWRLYQSRFFNDNKKNSILNDIQDLNSLDIKNKKILVFAEQGLGDQILYLSMLHDLVKFNQNEFTVLIDTRLIPIFERSFPSIEFLPKNTEKLIKQFDYKILSGSLGVFFRNSIEDFTSDSYYLVADKQKTKKIKNLFHSVDKKICGISWKSQNEKIGHNKSLTLDKLMPLLKLKNIQFVDLQYGDNKEEVNNVKNNFGIDIISIEEIDKYNDLDGLISLIDACDFVVTASNVTAHLAGSIKKETYLALPHAQGKIWYWHNNDNRSLWYPSIAQYIQEFSGNWDSVINKIVKDISEKYFE